MDLRKWRTQHEITLADMSDALGVSIGQLSHLELGKRKWSVDLAKKIEAFTRGKVTAASLLGLNEAKRARPGVQEDAAAFDDERALTIEVPIAPEQARYLRESGADIEAIARAGAEKALKDAEARAWADRNREAIEASNRWIEKYGTLAEQLGLI